MESGSVDLQGVLAEFSKRVSCQPDDLQRVFCEDGDCIRESYLF